MSQVLRAVHKQWVSLISLAKKDKWKKFGRQAAESHRFYSSDDHSFIFQRDYAAGRGQRVVSGSEAPTESNSGLTFEATANLVANVVSVFLPVLYHRNPIRVANARKQPIPHALMAAFRKLKVQQQIQASVQQMQSSNPMMPPLDPMAVQQYAEQLAVSMMPPEAPNGMTEKELTDRLRGSLIETYLNYTPGELNLKESARDSIAEAIIKGMGLLAVEVDDSNPDRRVAGLKHMSVDHLLIDPDAESWVDAKWMARRRRRPIWEVERDFDLPPGSLKEHATDQSTSATSAQGDEAGDSFDTTFDVAHGVSNDLIVYYEVWSRMGIGNRIKNTEKEYDDAVNEALDSFGDYVYLAICPNHEVPLNLPEEIVDNPDLGQEIATRLEWPIPFYKNRKNPFPFSPLMFRRIPRQVWPMSYIQPAMGYQKCINWILSFMMSRIKLSSRAFITVPKSLDEAVKNQLLQGNDLELIEINNAHPGTMEKIVDFIKMPDVNESIWELFGYIKREFEDATGVTELNMSARSDTQMRSAAEADMKRDILSVRPDDMANEVDNWMSESAKLEAIAARYLLRGEDVAALFGEEVTEAQIGTEQGPAGVPGTTEQPPVAQYGEFTQLWIDLVQTDDVDRIMSEYEYAIQSGSVRKPDRAAQAQTLEQTAQMVVPQYLQIWNTTGDPTKFNAWMEMYARINGFQEWENLMLPDMTQQVQMQQQMAMASGGPPQSGGGPPEQTQGPPPEQPTPQPQQPPQPAGPPQ